MYDVEDTKQLLARIAEVFLANEERFTDLDQKIGDGDLGITLSKIARVLKGGDVQNSEITDIGKFLFDTGMATNRAAASTMGTLLSTALMEAGKTTKGREALDHSMIAEAFTAGVNGIRKRGKANLGDKTILDALIPAAEKFEQRVSKGAALIEATKAAASAAAKGRDEVTPLQSRIGRASWVGERTKGQVDAGSEMAAVVLECLSTRT